MEERLIYENKSPDVIVTTERVIVGGKVIPADTAECLAVFFSKGLIFKKNRFYIAYSDGNKVFAYGNQITYAMTRGLAPGAADWLTENGVFLHLVSNSLSKNEMGKLRTDINAAIKKAKTWQRAEADNEVQSERESIMGLKRL